MKTFRWKVKPGMDVTSAPSVREVRFGDGLSLIHISAMAINRVASSAISQSASLVARETKVRRKLVKERARLKRATVKSPQARIKVTQPEYGQIPPVNFDSGLRIFDRGPFQPGPFFYQFPAYLCLTGNQ